MNNIEKVKSVKEIKKLIDKVMLPGYYYKTNFSSPDFLIDINYNLIIKANLVKEDNKMVYRFILDTQFLSDKEISYDELMMIVRIIEILEENRKFVLARLKKYTVEEYEKEMEEKEKRCEMMLESLKKIFIMKYEQNNDIQDINKREEI